MSEPAGGEPASEPVQVLITRLDPDVPLPTYAHPGDAGADLVAAEDVVLPPGERRLVRTGVAVALPDGYVGLVHPRSGLADRMGVTVLNAPGTVDAGYRGEIRVNLVNHDPVRTARLARGDRIAQLVVQKVERACFHLVAELPGSSRGTGGHGSTGGFSNPSAGGAARVRRERTTAAANVSDNANSFASPALSQPYDATHEVPTAVRDHDAAGSQNPAANEEVQ